MLCWLDFKNIFIWFGFRRFFAMLSFFLFYFLLRDGILLEGACACHMALHVPYACAHWSFQNSGRYKCTPRGMVVEVRFVPPGPSNWREKKQTKKKSKGISSHWLLGKNSKRHNFIGSKRNHALQKVICSFKYKYNFLGEGFWFIVISWISRWLNLNAASHSYLEK